MPTTPVQILALSPFEQNTLDALLLQLEQKRPRNHLRAVYYDAKNASKDLGISTPPNFQRITTVLGWPAKSVDVLNRRCKLEGFHVLGAHGDPYDIGGIWDDNHLDSEAPQAGVSSLIHSVAWLVTSRGDVQSGEPEVLVTARDALTGTALRDPRRRILRAFLSVIDSNEAGEPTDLVMYLPTGNVFMRKASATARWSVERRPHRLGRVPVEPLVYQPRLGRPFGSSRISRPVISLTDMALRTVIRSEVSAEFYSAPQRVLLGATEDAFVNADGTKKTSWQAVMGRVWGIPRDPESGELPDVKQMPQMTQQPHMDQLRSLAQLFAGETSIPLASLGISGDANPTSADAYNAGRDDLTSEAEGTTDDWSPAYQRTVMTAVQLRDDLLEVPAELRRVKAKWRDHSNPSRAAAADAGLKQLQAFPELATTEVGLELLGLNSDQRSRVMAEWARGTGLDALQRVRQRIAARSAGAVPAALTAAPVAGADAR